MLSSSLRLSQNFIQHLLSLFLIDRCFMVSAQPSRSAADALRRSSSSSILIANVSKSSAPKDFPPAMKYFMLAIVLRNLSAPLKNLWRGKKIDL